VEIHASRRRRAYLSGSRTLINRVSTHRLAASLPAGDSLFGGDWTGEVHYCGIDPSPFHRDARLPSLRRELGIADDTFVVGHIANFRPQKNHLFSVEIAACLAERHPNSKVVFVGSGPERATIEQLANQRGLTDTVIFAGLRKDIPSLLTTTFDALVLPSFSEGLPLTGIEAQIAGRPILMADTITREIEIVPGLVRFHSLSSPASEWADTLLQMCEHRTDHESAFQAVSRSAFNIAVGARRLEEIYSA
jgi:glycosyltransferase involved in cell wall biosynthesis